MTAEKQKPENDLLDEICKAIRAEPIPDYHVVPKWVDLRANTKRKFMIRAAALVGFVLLSVSVVTFFSWLGTNSAFAQVQAAIAKTKSMRYKSFYFHGDKAPIVVSTVMVYGVGSHSDDPSGWETIINLDEKKTLTINRRERTAILLDMDPDRASKYSADKFFELIRDMPANGAKSLGKETWNGKNADKYEIKLLGSTYIALVAPETKLPLKLEQDLENGLPGGKRFRCVITDFVFDSSVDESVFAMQAPVGYKLSVHQVPKDRKPIDPSKLLVSPTKGIGDVAFGASKDEIIAKFGEPDGIDEIAPANNSIPESLPKSEDGQVAFNQPTRVAMIGQTRISYASMGFELTVMQDRGLTRINCFGRDSHYYGGDFQGTTDDQIRLGASVDDVIKAFGRPQVHHKSVVEAEERLRYLSRGYLFICIDSKVVGFDIERPLADNIEVKDNGDGSWTMSFKDSK
jgi:hypothetical protein